MTKSQVSISKSWKTPLRLRVPILLQSHLHFSNNKETMAEMANIFNPTNNLNSQFLNHPKNLGHTQRPTTVQ